MKLPLSSLICLIVFLFWSCQNQEPEKKSNDSTLIQTAEKANLLTGLVALKPAEENCGNCHYWHIKEGSVSTLDYKLYNLSLALSGVEVGIMLDSQAVISLHDSEAILLKDSLWKLQSSSFTNAGIDSVKFFLQKLSEAHASLVEDSSIPKHVIDTIIDNWRVFFEPTPQGASDWQWRFSNEEEGGRFTTLYFTKNRKFLWRTTSVILNGQMALEPSVPNERLAPPIPLSRIKIK